LKIEIIEEQQATKPNYYYREMRGKSGRDMDLDMLMPGLVFSHSDRDRKIVRRQKNEIEENICANLPKFFPQTRRHD
jgi:hypothetical protein